MTLLKRTIELIGTLSISIILYDPANLANVKCQDH